MKSTWKQTREDGYVLFNRYTDSNMCTVTKDPTLCLKGHPMEWLTSNPYLKIDSRID